MTDKSWTIALLLSVFLLMLSGHAYPSNVKINCTDCHDNNKFKTHYKGSVHGNIGCTGCHTSFESLDRHVILKEKPLLVSCGKCHSEVEKAYKNNFHYLYEDFRCYDCHYEIHSLKPEKDNFKIAVTKNCTKCHANNEYVLSGHGAAVMKGNKDSATCSDCHGLHDTKAYHTSSEKYALEAREFYNRTCKSCHSDREMMKRNNLSPDTVKYYEETYHGKVQDLGYPTSVAGCADCHTTHNILAKDHPDSSINPKNLTKNCEKCHHGIHPRFAEYKAHPDYKDRKRYPLLYLSFITMVALLLTTFGFYWTHTLLWWRKVYWEKHRLEELGIKPESPFTHEEGIQEIRRFSIKDRVMHLLLILSFFGLVITGFPIKYHSTPWAKVLIQVMGGAHNAGLYHRAAAIVLIGLFFIALWRCLHFIFPKGFGREGRKGWMERLFGPDSLMPNIHDWQQFKGMVKWFFNKGEYPKFDRWTYWEKFDFLAIFWGMVIIGGSGITLWAPETASYIYPGWVFNIASIFHSEEALLAAIFIFTVHFFNTHLIPTKFPMDPIIFTGSYKLEELWRFRTLEYERLVREKKLDDLKIKHPGISLKLISSMFGHASLWIGLLFTLILLWTFFFA
ncbi:MAG: cytochrome C [Proteobacteria bacterium]|nr:cytochrome C [Pseudomonadota bacterium]